MNWLSIVLIFAKLIVFEEEEEESESKESEEEEDVFKMEGEIEAFSEVE